ncbi:MAG: serine hydrolase domain-containing protein [Vicinamibacteraceae bacterium]
MGPATRPSKRVDPNDPIAQYLIKSPDPVADVSEDNVGIALNALKQAADAATRDVGGTRWTPGLSIVVVRRREVLLCDGYGRTRVDKSGKVGPETLFTCASLSKPVAATLLHRAFPHVGQPERSTALLEVDPTGWTWRVASRDQERNPTRQAPAGGLMSCARDLGQFLITLLKTDYLEFPPKNPPAEDLAGGHSYSLGWNVRNPGRDDVSFSHSGAFRLGAGTCVRFDPLSGFGVAVLSNGEPTGVPEALTALFFNQLYGSPLLSGADFAGLFAIVRPMMLGQMYQTKVSNYERYHGSPSEVPVGLPPGQIVFTGYSPYFASRIVIERKGTGLVLKLEDAGKGLPLRRTASSSASSASG